MSRPMPPTVEVQLKPEPSVGERRRLVILMYGGYCLFGVAVTAGLNDDNYRGAGLGGVILSFIAMAYGFFRLTGPIFAGGPVVGNRLAEARQQARLNQALRRAMPVLLLGATLYLGLAATAIPFFRTLPAMICFMFGISLFAVSLPAAIVGWIEYHDEDEPDFGELAKPLPKVDLKFTQTSEEPAAPVESKNE